MILSLLNAAAWLLILAGLGFFVTGAVGLLRFPDIFTRLHAVTKADTVGLGLLALGLALQARSPGVGLLLLLIWLMVMFSGAVNCQLLARYSCEQEARGQVSEDDEHA